MRVARRSRIVDRGLNLLLGTGRNDPAENARLMAAVAARAGRLVEEELGGRFVVLFWDNETDGSGRVLAELDDAGLTTLRVSDHIPVDDRDAYTIPDDGHPNGEANRVLAQVLLPLLEDGR